MDMKRIVTLFVVVIFVTSCGNKGGIGGGSRKGFEAVPEEMILIQRGSYEMGSNDEDYVWAMNTQLKRRTVDQFYMDLTETTNLNYRAFVYWTADSIARRMLASAGVEGFAKEENDEEEEDVDPEEVPLNYKKAIHLSPKQRDYSEHYETLKGGNFFYSKQESLGQKRAIDVRKLNYKYRYYDLQQAAKAKWVVDDQNPNGGHYVGKYRNQDGELVDVQDRSSFIIEEIVPVYPDTLTWIRDFSYSYNDPYAKSYFWHPAYDYYPVVGVSWKQASAFCHWKSYHAKEKRYRNQFPAQEYRLPTESEWEYAARGGLEGNLYPWGSQYTTNSKGCFLANFKPQRGDYALDGFTRTSAVAQYEPNEFGLYDMAGNVAEWINDTYEEDGYSYTHDLVPTYHRHVTKKDKANKKRKVVRGGSWKDVSYFLQTGARDYNYMDSTHSYIGFRTVRDAVVGGNQPR
jgi:formylglycine-generating enzyme required for sulfatase activity